MKIKKNKLIKFLIDENGQALVEAVIVFPILILIIWGIYHMHISAFYNARAAMAVRHAAWVKSVDENKSALSEGLNAFFGSSNANADSLSYIKIDSFNADQAGLDERDEPSAAAKAANAIFPMEFLESFLDSFAIFQPFTRNALSTLTFHPKTPITIFEDEDDTISKVKYKNKAYFPCRLNNLYFHNSWDFFKVDIGNDLDEAVSSADSGMEDANDAFSDQSDNVSEDELNGEAGGNIYNYDDYKEALEKWREWMRNR